MKRTPLAAAVAGLALVLSSGVIAKGQPEPGGDRGGGNSCNNFRRAG